MLKGYDDALAKDCLDTAIKAWNDENAHPTQNRAGVPGAGVLAASQGAASGTPANSGTASAPSAPPANSSRGGFGALDWAAALELTIATNGAEPYKSRLKELFPQMIAPQQMGYRGWTAVRALPYLEPGAKDQMRAAVKTYMAGLDKQLDITPFGVPPSREPGADRALWLTWPSGCTSCTKRFLIL